MLPNAPSSYIVLSDFDEQTTDDLDVDFSPYEEPGSGDKDIKDFLKIRQEARWGGFLKMYFVIWETFIKMYLEDIVVKEKDHPKANAFYFKSIFLCIDLNVLWAWEARMFIIWFNWWKIDQYDKIII